MSTKICSLGFSQSDIPTVRKLKRRYLNSKYLSFIRLTNSFSFDFLPRNFIYSVKNNALILKSRQRTRLLIKGYCQVVGCGSICGTRPKTVPLTCFSNIHWFAYLYAVWPVYNVKCLCSSGWE